MRTFWAGNLSTVFWAIRTQAPGFALFDTILYSLPNTNSQQNVVSFILLNFVAGSLAGSVVPFLSYPVDYSRKLLIRDLSSVPRKFNGLGDCMKKTIQNSPYSVLALYKGFIPSLAAVLPYYGVYFGMYRSLRTYTSKESYLPVLPFQLLLAQITSISAQFVCYPINLIRSESHSYWEMLRRNGVRGLWKGFTRAHHSFYLTPAITLVLFDQLKSYFERDPLH